MSREQVTCLLSILYAQSPVQLSTINIYSLHVYCTVHMLTVQFTCLLLPYSFHVYCTVYMFTVQFTCLLYSLLLVYSTVYMSSVQRSSLLCSILNYSSVYFYTLWCICLQYSLCVYSTVYVWNVQFIAQFSVHNRRMYKPRIILFTGLQRGILNLRQDGNY